MMIWPFGKKKESVAAPVYFELEPIDDFDELEIETREQPPENRRVDWMPFGLERNLGFASVKDMAWWFEDQERVSRLRIVSVNFNEKNMPLKLVPAGPQINS